MVECNAGNVAGTSWVVFRGNRPQRRLQFSRQISRPHKLRGISLTSARFLRLWLVAGPEGVRDAAAARKLPVDASADARTGPTVTQTLEEHLGTVYRYALRLAGQSHLAEDMTQETMLRACRSWHRLRDERTARVWLLQIATNTWRDHLRKSKFRPRELEVEPECRRPAAAVTMRGQENVALALAAMDELPPRQRQVLYLVTCEQLTQDEVANILGITKWAVKASLSAARKEMRARLKDVYQEVCGEKVCEEHQS
jgi:RNA polymerase sigma-70 factor, ECF subfamily